MNRNTLDRLPRITAAVLAALVIAACTIRLRGEDNQATSANSTAQVSDPMAEELEQCLSVAADQPEVLTECRKVWAEKHREFLGKASPSTPEGSPSLRGSPFFIPPNDESGSKPGSSGNGPIPQPGQE
jgi:conjugative transfer region protein TrbK